ncbi:MAG: hypothetical protein HFJ12_01110 [Bacilli bacterium]|nr:hypothetical protein [Bacilli bacterium]
MSNKKSTLILILLGILSIVLGFIIMFISNIKKDQQEMNSRMTKIGSKYEVFKKKVEEINVIRDNLHKEFLDTIYYETFSENELKYRKSLYNYEKLVTDLSKKNSTLKEYCKSGIYYSSSDVNNKCNAFNLAYEQLINTFVDDVNKYNGNIAQYNKWLKEQNKNESEKIENYATKKTYIDYNKDGQYSGKEE